LGLFGLLPQLTSITSYTITVTDANGCTETATIEVEVIDVSCGNNPNNPKVEICHNGRTICVSQNAVQAHLNHGDTLGSCNESLNEVIIAQLGILPNPLVDNLNLRLRLNTEASVDFIFYDFYGIKVFEAQEQLNKGNNTLIYNLGHLNQGLYILKVVADGELIQPRVIVKN
jgi:hypothetical protein